MTKFQTGGVKNKGVVDNLFVLRGLIDHSKLWNAFTANIHIDFSFAYCTIFLNHCLVLVLYITQFWLLSVSFFFVICGCCLMSRLFCFLCKMQSQVGPPFLHSCLSQWRFFYCLPYFLLFDVWNILSEALL